MNIAPIYDFIQQLVKNNNREWMQLHKEEYEQVKKLHEEFISYLIPQIALFDDEVSGLNAKDCIYRIHRDVRFSPDKTPYKNHIGAYIATHGGRKSERAGYYIHIGPDESFVSGGVYCPQPKLLKALREAVYHNIDEYLSIINQDEYKTYFTGFFSDSLKIVPRGFPKDFQYAEYLKYRHYSPSSPIPNEMWKSDTITDEILKRCKVLHTYNKFMNYTVDECLFTE